MKMSQQTSELKIEIYSGSLCSESIIGDQQEWEFETECSSNLPLKEEERDNDSLEESRDAIGADSLENSLLSPSHIELLRDQSLIKDELSDDDDDDDHFSDDQKGMECKKECNQRRSSSESDIHLGSTNQREGPNTCSVCGLTFKTMYTLRIHMRVHIDEKPYVCDICGKCFKFSSSYQAHKKSHNEKRPLLCELCSKPYENYKQLVSHMETHYNDNPLSYNVSAKRSTVRSKIETDRKSPSPEPELVCDMCMASFKSSAVLTPPLDSIETPYLCEICTKAFEYESIRSQDEHKHNKQKQSLTLLQERIFTCNICEETFKFRNAYEQHLRTHNVVQPYSCSVCTKSFRYFFTLKQHMRSHTDERPFPCGICGKRFRSASHCSGHQKVHTDERPFQCNLCRKAYNRASNLKRHMKSHRDHRSPTLSDDAILDVMDI